MIKTIAFYLPQFHAIPENDIAYGKGFTEWTNTKKATPLFEGHYQPKTPLNSNYYNLLDDGVMKKQIELAKKYGIYGFCYYHYWFKNGKKLLEKPIEMMLNNPELDMPFCLSWANENWSKKWDGGNNEIIVEQDYGDDNDLLNHVDYLCDFFKDKRYICIDGLPLLLIYKPELIPDIRKTISIIRKRVKENGILGIKIFVQYPKYYFDGANLDIFDGYVQFEPKFIQDYGHQVERSRVKRIIKKILIEVGANNLVNRIENVLASKKGNIVPNELTIRDYDDDWTAILDYKVEEDNIIAGAFTDWDNTPRNKNGLLYKNSSPEKFGKYFSKLVTKVKSEYYYQYIFINAWNEWAEGAYLEPDEKYKYQLLEELSKALKG